MAHNHTDHAESPHTHAPPHDHGHRHGAHGHAPVNGRAFAIGIGLNLSFVLTEAVFGVLGHSLALLADAGHNLSDVLGLLMAWGASALANRPLRGDLPMDYAVRPFSRRWRTPSFCWWSPAASPGKPLSGCCTRPP
ncbi:Cadmium, cobalt and zinc/H(+)-K(+) antiporter [Acidithiobacillus ferridurans]|uniref:Cadmium, cobalt and zinc/H(+)-K(+) antiporter n=1 Tax=Acidithiobacillus ferridurans TaxID=1232575 RepID=A0A2Z6IMM7_ACIFI|nr:cation transporter [Acidithiobacillus ferridurans]BBF66037.1 Cadmium, cobalt and zinc/H(+)-K(+) antiporter [Acidithiobacillus ferridurans]